MKVQFGDSKIQIHANRIKSSGCEIFLITGKRLHKGKRDKRLAAYALDLYINHASSNFNKRVNQAHYCFAPLCIARMVLSSSFISLRDLVIAAQPYQ